MKEPSKALQRLALSAGFSLENDGDGWRTYPQAFEEWPAPLWLRGAAFGLGESLGELAALAGAAFPVLGWRGLPFADKPECAEFAQVGILSSGLVVEVLFSKGRESPSLTPFPLWLFMTRPDRNLSLLARSLRFLAENSNHPRTRTEAARVVALVASYRARLARHQSGAKRKPLRLAA